MVTLRHIGISPILASKLAMAELVISVLAEAVVSQAVERIAEILIHEAVSLKSVKGDVERLLTELRRTQCFLKDADRKQEQDERVRNWIKEVKEVANDVEDVIEIFITRVSSSYIKVFHLRRLKKEINSVQEKIDNILKSTQAYRIEFSSGEGTSSVARLQRELRRSHPDDEDEDVIGVEDSVKALKVQLMKAQDQRCVVSIVGMGGLGKTTLAKIVYNHSDVKQHFDCCAWVYISQQYVWEDILYQILVQLEMDMTQRDKLRALKHHELTEKLKDKLKDRRYLVVLDDIWEIKAWDGIKNAFPKGKCGSKVLFTTRNKEVAMRADPGSSLIEPSCLTSEESWKLLQRKAFCKDGFDEHNLPPRLWELGNDMVRKCGGLPLAIVTLGGLLRTRNSVLEWEEVQKDLNAYLNKIHSGQSYEGVNGILALSYNDLPYYLKPCFLYLGSFPEDKEIPKRKLIQQWIAEGLIVQTTRQSRNQEKEKLEEIAEQYLGELTDRCMIQVGRRNESRNGVKAYRIHDLMRDLCLSRARDENFLDLVQDHQMDTISSRRIVIHGGRMDLGRYQVKTHLRSLLYSNEALYSCDFRSESFLLLRVLEICINSSLEARKLKSIGTLIHLRYLGLFVKIGMHLPNSIGKLRNLHTLHIRGLIGTCILPKGISRCTRLTHLLIPELGLKKNKYQIHSFSVWDDLTSPSFFRRTFRLPTSRSEIRYSSLVKLTNLQRLKLNIRNGQEAKAILESPIIRSGHLGSLDLIAYGIDNAFQSLQALSHCDGLCRLQLNGVIKDPAIGSCNHCLQPLPASLSKLTLKYSQMKTDPMSVLEKLPNLRHLRLLRDAYKGSKMVCSAHGFPKLETIELDSLDSVEEWRIEKDALPSLKRLTLRSLPLRVIPEGFQFVTTLAQLDISRMNNDLKARVRVNEDGVEGEDFYKVRHIPSILF